MVQIYTDDSRKFEKIIFLIPYIDIYPFKHNFSRSNNCLSEHHQLYSFTRCFIEFVSCLFKDFLLFFNTTIKSSCYPEWCEVTWNFSWYLMSNITRIELLTLSINKFASLCSLKKMSSLMMFCLCELISRKTWGNIYRTISADWKSPSEDEIVSHNEKQRGQ